jgi:glycosyltransferase involved in cell wall biosynthesis
MLLCLLLYLLLQQVNPLPLLIDVEWVLQGFEINFSGFTVEALGYLAGLNDVFPGFRITQSSFRQTFSDLPHPDMNLFVSKMFSKEANLMNWAFGRQVAMIDNNTIFPTFSYSSLNKVNATDNICQQLHNNIHEAEIISSNDNVIKTSIDYGIHRNTALIGGNLGKSYVPFATSAYDCCQACYNYPLCVAWTYNATINYDHYNDGTSGCQLKGILKLIKNVTSDAQSISGNIGRVSVPKVTIFHGTTCYFQNITYVPTDPNVISIGRYMVERHNFYHAFNHDEIAVSYCSGIVEEIWVPTEWHKSIFIFALKRFGIPHKSIVVIPEAVDTDLFDPSLSPPRDNNPIFNFLSIFKWEYRKGWDLLLQAYWDSFTVTDPVVLRLKTYVPKWYSGNKNVTYIMEEFALEKYNKTLAELPRVQLEDEHEASTRVDMRNLLSSVDCFVLPTRGEGWGLPIAEAMAMALPVIVTNFSGPTAYANDENSYLIPVANEYDQHGFAIPDVNTLKSLLKQVIIDSKVGIAQTKGIKAREKMKEFSPSHVTNLMVERIKVLVERRGFKV